MVIEQVVLEFGWWFGLKTFHDGMLVTLNGEVNVRLDFQSVFVLKNMKSLLSDSEIVIESGDAGI